MKIHEAFAEFRRHEVLAMNYSPSTFESYLNAEKKAIAYFGDIPISAIDIDKVHEYYLGMLHTCCPDTARSYLSKLRVVLRYCRNHGENTIDPEQIKLPRREKKVARFLTLQEYSKFMNEIDRSHRGYKNVDRYRNTLVAEMLFVTGLRINELCALNRDSISNRQFVVVGKSKEPRVCFITEEVENKIKHYLSMRTDSNCALFVDHITGERVKARNIQRVFRRVSRSSGISACTPHTMRHSFATYMVEEGVDIRFVAALLGHQSLQTTQKYTHIRDAKLQQIYESTMGCGKLRTIQC